MSSANVTGLKRLPMAHPAVILASWAVIAIMLVWGYRTGLREPELWLASSVAVVLVVLGVLSRRRQARKAPPVPAAGPVLDIDRR